ncbi:MAG: pantetheine-phosphate adenylyltransferase [Bacteroidia bacterium]
MNPATEGKPRIAVFPGTFDPITRGHEDIVRRAADIFDRVIIAMGRNTKKQSLFPLEERMAWIREIFKDDPRIEVDTYDELTVEYCRRKGATFIVRGLRSSGDFEYEAHLAQVNRKLDSSIETIFIITSPELSNISSTVVRDIIIYGGDYTPFVPPAVRPVRK